MCPLSARQASDVLGNMASAASSWRSMRQRDKNHRTQKPRLVFAFVRCLKEWRREDVSWSIDLQATLGISSLSQPDLASWHHWQTKVPLAADVTVSSQTLTWQGGWWWVRNRLFRDSRRAFFVFFFFLLLFSFLFSLYFFLTFVTGPVSQGVFPLIAKNKGVGLLAWMRSWSYQRSFAVEWQERV